MTGSTDALRVLADKPAWTRGEQEQWGREARAALHAVAERQAAVEALLEVTPVLMYGIPPKPVDVVLADDIRTALATDATPEPQQETT